MTTLTRWDPFREMVTFRNMVDRFFEDSLWPMSTWQRSEGFPLSLDVAEDDKGFIVKASIPGVDPENVEVTLMDNTLTIKGETKEEQDINEKNYHLRERHYGSFMRSVTLPNTVDADKIEATHENGVLTLTIPKSESAQPKRIAVKSTINGRQNGHKS